MAVAGLAIGTTPDVSYDASVHAELRAGNALNVALNNDSVGTEIALIPSLTVRVIQGTDLYSLQYDPQLLLPFYVAGTGVLALQRAKGLASWGGPSGAHQLSLSEDFQYGTTDFFALSRTTSGLSPQLQPLPTVTTLLYVYSNSQGVIGLRLSRTEQLTVTAGYLINGGADRLAQLSLPLQQGPYALGALRETISRWDDLETDVVLSESTFSLGSTLFLGEVTEGWTHQWTRDLKVDLAAGGSVVSESQTPGAPFVTSGYPVARAIGTELRQTSADRTLHASLLLELAPYIDRLTGNGYERTQGLFSADWSAPRGFGALVQGGYAVPLYGNLQGANIVELAALALDYQPQPFLRFDAGIRGVWQQPLPGVTAPSSFQWVGFVGVLLKAGGPL